MGSRVAESKEPKAKWYIVECSNKRRKMLPPLEELNHQIHSLLDELLVEIFCRLPCSKSVHLCKCVCRRWAALISRPCFITRFILSKIEERSYAIVARTQISRLSRDTWKGVTMQLRHPNSNFHNFSFSSLPRFKDGNATSFTVVAACDDLLVYRSDEFGRDDFYICNVQTNKWLMLRSPDFFYRQYSQVGFICDPFYCCRGSGNGSRSSSNVMLNTMYRYSVVVVPYTTKAASQYRAHLLSSDTAGQWSDIVLSLPKPIRLYKDPGFCFDGKILYLYHGGIFGFDPFNKKMDGVIHCHLINRPGVFLLGWYSVCKGRLLTASISDDGVLAIWRLKCYQTGEWSLQHNIPITEWIPRDISMKRYLRKNSSPKHPVGFHPINPDIIYCLGDKWIYLCNLSTREVEVASRRPKGSVKVNPCFHAFQLLLPVWPTPLPASSVY